MLLSVFAVPVLALFSAVSACDSTFPPDSTTPSQVKAAWYAGWHATEGFPLSSIAWDKYNTLFYSFAVPTASVDLVSLDGSDAQLLPQFVSEAKSHGVKAQVAIGGWTGSLYFSSDLNSADNRTKFASAVMTFVNDYQLDGLQFDWEYPNKQGVGCNTISSDDTANFLAFLQELRQQPSASSLTLSAAVSLKTFIGADGQPTPDVSGFAQVLDYIAVMDYDVWGSWSATVGPNAPLNDTCAAPANQQGSAVSAVAAWMHAGMPADQIVLGVAAYGHSFRVTIDDAFMAGTNMLAPYPAFDAKNPPLGDSWDNVGGTDVCGVYQPQGGTYTLSGLVQGGFLTSQAQVANSIIYRYDNCSQTAYVYNTTSQVMVSYDDAQAFAAKGKYITETGLRGFSMWEAGGDYNNILLDAISGAL